MSSSKKGQAGAAGFDSVRLRRWKPEENTFSGPTETQVLEDELRGVASDRRRRTCARGGMHLDQEGNLTWIHIPSNDMGLCEKVLNTICNKAQVDHVMSKDHWVDRQHDPLIISNEMENTQDDRVRPQFLEPSAFNLVFGVPEDNDPWVLLRANDMRTSGKEHVGTKISHKVSTLILYMPYLHWDNLENHQKNREKDQESRKNDRKPRQESPVKLCRHPRRSLDQATNRSYPCSVLAKRDEDQVVTRFLNDRNQKPTLMMIDQLWLWMLDENTLVTSFPETPCKGHEQSLDCPDLNLQCLALRQADGKRGDLTAKRMTSHLIYRCYMIFLHRRISNARLRYIDMFEMSIAEQRANSSELLRCLQTRKQFGSKFKVGPRQEKETALKEQPPLDKGRLRDRFSLSNDIVAVRIVRDINEELHMILHVIEQQSKVLRDSGHPHENIWEQDLNDFKTRIDKLSLEATSINELLFQTLQLKQAQLSARQNEVVLTFTIVTIIFLPLSFMTSIFGMNAAEISDGAPISLRTIFAYIIPISIALSLVALVLAFSHDVADWVQGWRKATKEHKESNPEDKASGKGKQPFRSLC